MANACKTSPGRSLSAPLAVDWADAGHCLVVAPMSDSCSSRADVEVFGVPVSLAGADLGEPLSPASARRWQSIDDGATVTCEKHSAISIQLKVPCNLRVPVYLRACRCMMYLKA